MQQHRQIRIIKREQRAAQVETPAPVEEASGSVVSERKLKTVVSGWVREHQERAEEYKRMFSVMLAEAGFRAPRTPSRA
ncbi:MAG TPA: hypothetical protein VF791_00995 [Pyrinomonadaceae bacterium]